jgi:hypothetical protein
MNRNINKAHCSKRDCYVEEGTFLFKGFETTISPPHHPPSSRRAVVFRRWCSFQEWACPFDLTAALRLYDIMSER